MTTMKIDAKTTEEAYNNICQFFSDLDYFNYAAINYKVGQKVDFSKPKTWPFRLLRVEGKEIKTTLMIAIATAGYNGVGPLFTYDVLKMFGFEPDERLFNAENGEVKVMYKREG